MIHSKLAVQRQKTKQNKNSLSCGICRTVFSIPACESERVDELFISARPFSPSPIRFVVSVDVQHHERTEKQ